ncbi:hypothetical protein NMY22_g19868 [Coprinellus aureogranulatus]|nr:hypothetical protein NMY22_g19868 [Coprinellus aureogranulatus]
MPLDGGLIARKSCLSDLPDELLLLIVLKLGLGDLLRVRTVSGRPPGQNAVTDFGNPDMRSPRPDHLLSRSLVQPFPSRLRHHASSPFLSSKVSAGLLRTRPRATVPPVGRSSTVFQSPSLQIENTLRTAPSSLRDPSSLQLYCLAADTLLRATTEVMLRRLIPPPYLNSSGFDVPIKLAVDLISEDSLGLSLASHHLVQFNIAVVTWRGECSINDTEINIWRVRLDEDGGGLELDEHLSTFHDAPFLHVLDCSLLGPVVAYNLGDWACAPRSVIVVEWAKARGKPRDEVPRLYIPRLPATATV